MKASEKLELINTIKFIEDDADGECCNSVTIEDNETNRRIINDIGFDNDYINSEMVDVADGYLNIAVIAFKYCNWWNGDYFTDKEEDTDEYVIVYITGNFSRETSIDATNKEEAIKRFKETIGDYEVQSCELSDQD